MYVSNNEILSAGLDTGSYQYPFYSTSQSPSNQRIRNRNNLPGLAYILTEVWSKAQDVSDFDHDRTASRDWKDRRNAEPRGPDAEI